MHARRHTDNIEDRDPCMHGGVKLHNKGRVQGIYIHIANYTNAAQSHKKSLRHILVSW